MRGYSIMSDEERQSILQQHSSFYNGYAVGNVPSNLTPLTVYDPAGDKGGITVDNKGDVSTYKNHMVNESTISEQKGKGCAKSEGGTGCIEQEGNEWIIYNNKKGGIWRDGFKSEKDAQEALDAFHANESVMSEIEADDMDVSYVEPADDFKSGGPEQFADSDPDKDPYDMDLEAIMRMFDYGDDEKEAYDFESEGGNMDVYGESVVNEEYDKGLKLPTNVKFPDIKGWERPNKRMSDREETAVMYKKGKVTVTFRQNQADENKIEISVVGDDDLKKQLAGSIERNDLQSKIDMFKKWTESLNEGMIEENMSEKEIAWEEFLELNPSINSKTIKGARKHFEDMWSKTNSDVNEEEETESMCEQCGLSESICECGMYEEIDSDLHESFRTQKERITEMFNRFKNYN